MQSLSWQESLSLRLASTRRQMKQLYVARLADLEVTPQQMTLLFCLAEEAPTTLRTLAARARTDEPTASRVVQRLVARGEVRSLPNPGDRRCMHLELTAAGRRQVRKLSGIAAEVEAALTRGLSRAELNALHQGLLKISENVRRESQPAAEGGLS